MNKKTIILAAAAVVVAGVVLTIALVNRSNKKDEDSIKVNAGDGIVVNTDILTNGNEYDTSDELEIMSDDGPVDLDNWSANQSGSDAAAGEKSDAKGKGNESASGGSGSKSQPEMQVVNPVAPNANGNSSAGSNTSSDSSNSGSNSGSGSNSSGGNENSATGGMIKENQNEEPESAESSYDASEGRSFETERIPVQ